MIPEDSNQAPHSETGAPASGGTASSDPGAPPVDWRGAIRDDGLRKHAERFASLDDLIQGNINLRKRVSGAAVVPGDDASEAERAEFRRRTGVPEPPAGYGVAPPPGVPAALLPTEDNGGIARQAKFLDVFHRHNLTPAAVNDILNLYYAEAGGDMAAAVQADRTYADRCAEALRTEWGTDYDRNRTLAGRAAEQIFAGDFEAVRQLQDGSGRYVLDHPLIVRALAKIGREMSEDRLGAAAGDGHRQTLTAEIDELQAEKTRALAAGDTARAQDLQRRQAALYDKLHGSGPVVGAGGRVV